MSKNLVIVLSDDEYDEIHQMAARTGLSASKFAYDKLFLDAKDSFEMKWNQLLDNLDKYPTGAEFDTGIVAGVETWKNYDRGTKLSLARTLKRKVDDGTLANVEIVGRSSSNVTVYRKK